MIEGSKPLASSLEAASPVVAAKQARYRSEINQLFEVDRAAHGWYRFVLSFPPHLVRDYLQRFGIGSEQRVLDPFCGTGTTVVECKKLGIPSVGGGGKLDGAVCGSGESRLEPRSRSLDHCCRASRCGGDRGFSRSRTQGHDCV